MHSSVTSQCIVADSHDSWDELSWVALQMCFGHNTNERQRRIVYLCRFWRRRRWCPVRRRWSLRRWHPVPARRWPCPRSDCVVEPAEIRRRRGVPAGHGSVSCRSGRASDRCTSARPVSVDHTRAPIASPAHRPSASAATHYHHRRQRCRHSNGRWKVALAPETPWNTSSCPHLRHCVRSCGIMELSFPRTFAPGNESSVDGTFAPENFRSHSQRNVVLLPNTNYDYLVDKLMEIKALLFVYLYRLIVVKDGRI